MEAEGGASAAEDSTTSGGLGCLVLDFRMRCFSLKVKSDDADVSWGALLCASSAAVDAAALLLEPPPARRFANAAAKTCDEGAGCCSGRFSKGSVGEKASW